jgi:hypothetical protein
MDAVTPVVLVPVVPVVPIAAMHIGMLMEARKTRMAAPAPAMTAPVPAVFL